MSIRRSWHPKYRAKRTRGRAKCRIGSPTTCTNLTASCEPGPWSPSSGPHCAKIISNVLLRCNATYPGFFPAPGRSLPQVLLAFCSTSKSYSISVAPVSFCSTCHLILPNLLLFNDAATTHGNKSGRSRSGQFRSYLSISGTMPSCIQSICALKPNGVPPLSCCLGESQ